MCPRRQTWRDRLGAGGEAAAALAAAALWQRQQHQHCSCRGTRQAGTFVKNVGNQQVAADGDVAQQGEVGGALVDHTELVFVELQRGRGRGRTQAGSVTC